jgi:hypothetical protein
MSKLDPKQPASYAPKTPCPQCGKPKSLVSELCRQCAADKRRSSDLQREAALKRWKPPPAGFVTLTVAAAALGMHPGSVLYHIQLGRLPASKRDGRWLIRETEVNKWLGANRSGVAKAREIVEQDSENLIEWPAVKRQAKQVERAADVDFLLGELRQKSSYLESENRRLMDQNTRFRDLILRELRLWQALIRDAKPISYGEAKRHISTLLGATNYDGRDDGPLEYREPSTGGNLRKLYERQRRGETDEPKEPPAEPAIIELARRPQYRPDRQGIRAIKKTARRLSEGG